MPLPNGERERMIEAVTRVAERSLFAFAECVPAELLPVTIDGGWHVASLQFDGPFSGRMQLAVPALLGRQICDACMGEDTGSGDAVRDLVGEFANMTCGTWLTQRQEASCFDLTHPDVVDADEVRDCDIAMVVNDLPVKLSIEIGGAP